MFCPDIGIDDESLDFSMMKKKKKKKTPFDMGGLDEALPVSLLSNIILCSVSVPNMPLFFL